jgi:hypothetical protein
MQHYLCLGGLTVRNFATRLRELNNYLPYCPREEGKAEPSKLSDDNLIQILRQSLKNVSRLFLVRTLNFISSIFKALLTILRNSKSGRHSKRNVARSKRPTILSLRKRAIETSQKINNQCPSPSLLSTKHAHTAVAQIMPQKTVGLALKTKGRPNPVRKMSVLLTRMS